MEKTSTLLSTLRAARQAKGLSQRALSERVGLPQSHLSRIENGAVDVQLSNLVEIARALDLDLVLVARQLRPALGALQREVAAPTTDTSKLHHVLSRIETRARQALPGLKGRDRDTIKQLLQLIGTARGTRLSQDVARQLYERMLEVDRHMEVIAAPTSNNVRKSRMGRLARYVESQRGLRNQLMHLAEHRASDQVPAYRLADDGG